MLTLAPNEDVIKTCPLLSQVKLNIGAFWYTITVMILSFRTDKPGQTVQTQIRLLPVWLPFRLHRLDSLLHDTAT